MNSSNRNNLLIGIIVGLVAGLLLGMVLFWGLFPVKWTDAHPYDLAPEAKADYVQLVADSFALHKDPQEAAGYFESWTEEELAQAFADAITQAEQEGRPDKAQSVRDLALVLGVTPAAAGVEGAEPAEPAESASLIDRFRVPCLVFFIVLFVLVVGWILLRMFQRRQSSTTSEAKVAEAAAFAPVAVQEKQGTGRSALGRFNTTYELGEDTYDESFSIETDTGDFMGECGVGISDTIGTGDHDKVTAFEVWLFDKSDIRTVTKVLMSEYVFQDQAQRAKLVSKGEPVLAQIGQPFLLETSSLQVAVNISELLYGSDDLPANSYFTKLTIEMVATAK